MEDLGSYSDEELMKIAGIAPASGGGDMESMSDEELMRIAGVGKSSTQAIPPPTIPNRPSEEELRSMVWAPHEAAQGMLDLGKVRPSPSTTGEWVGRKMEDVGRSLYGKAATVINTAAGFVSWPASLAGGLVAYLDEMGREGGILKFDPRKTKEYAEKIEATINRYAPRLPNTEEGEAAEEAIGAPLQWAGQLSDAISRKLGLDKIALPGRTGEIEAMLAQKTKELMSAGLAFKVGGRAAGTGKFPTKPVETEGMHPETAARLSEATNKAGWYPKATESQLGAMTLRDALRNYSEEMVAEFEAKPKTPSGIEQRRVYEQGPETPRERARIEELKQPIEPAPTWRELDEAVAGGVSDAARTSREAIAGASVVPPEPGSGAPLATPRDVTGEKATSPLRGEHIGIGDTGPLLHEPFEGQRGAVTLRDIARMRLELGETDVDPITGKIAPARIPKAARGATAPSPAASGAGEEGGAPPTAPSKPSGAKFDYEAWKANEPRTAKENTKALQETMDAVLNKVMGKGKEKMPPKMTTEQFGDLGKEERAAVFDKMFGKQPTTNVPGVGKVPSGRPVATTPKVAPTAAEAAKGAALHTRAAFKSGIDLLKKLQEGGERGSVSNKPIPPERYNEVKDILKKMHADAIGAGHAIEDFLVAVKNNVGDWVRPHLERFFNDLEEERAFNTKAKAVPKVVPVAAPKAAPKKEVSKEEQVAAWRREQADLEHRIPEMRAVVKKQQAITGLVEDRIVSPEEGARVLKSAEERLAAVKRELGRSGKRPTQAEYLQDLIEDYQTKIDSIKLSGRKLATPKMRVMEQEQAKLIRKLDDVRRRQGEVTGPREKLEPEDQWAAGGNIRVMPLEKFPVTTREGDIVNVKMANGDIRKGKVVGMRYEEGQAIIQMKPKTPAGTGEGAMAEAMGKAGIKATPKPRQATPIKVPEVEAPVWGGKGPSLRQAHKAAKTLGEANTRINKLRSDTSPKAVREIKRLMEERTAISEREAKLEGAKVDTIGEKVVAKEKPTSIMSTGGPTPEEFASSAYPTGKGAIPSPGAKPITSVEVAAVAPVSPEVARIMKTYGATQEEAAALLEKSKTAPPPQNPQGFLPAVRVTESDGSISMFPGKTHLEAVEAAGGYHEGMESGWMDSRGRWMTNNEAYSKVGKTKPPGNAEITTKGDLLAMDPNEYYLELAARERAAKPRTPRPLGEKAQGVIDRRAAKAKSESDAVWEAAKSQRPTMTKTTPATEKAKQQAASTKLDEALEDASKMLKNEKDLSVLDAMWKAFGTEKGAATGPMEAADTIIKAATEAAAFTKKHMDTLITMAHRSGREIGAFASKLGFTPDQVAYLKQYAGVGNETTKEGVVKAPATPKAAMKEIIKTKEYEGQKRIKALESKLSKTEDKLTAMSEKLLADRREKEFGRDADKVSTDMTKEERTAVMEESLRPLPKPTLLPGQHDTSNPYKTGDIVKRRNLGDTVNPLWAPAVQVGERSVVEGMKQLKRSVGHWNITVAGETFDKLGKGAKELLYRPLAKAGHNLTLELELEGSELSRMSKGINGKSRDRIGTWMIAQRDGGKVYLAKTGKEVPVLTAKEQQLATHLQDKFAKLFDRLQEARLRSGLEPFGKVDNYITFFENYTELQRLGFNPINAPTDLLENKFRHMRSTPFKFTHSRSDIYRVKTDALDIYKSYAYQALRHIHMGPEVAKGRELINSYPALGKRGEAGYVDGYSLKESNPNAYTFLNNYYDYAAGTKIDFHLPQLAENAIAQLTSNIAVSTMGGNFRSAGIQLTSLLNSYTELGSKYLARGIADLFVPGTSDMAKTMSNHILGRQYDASAMNIYKDTIMGKAGKGLQYAKKGSMAPLSFLDGLAALATRQGAFRKALDEGMSRDQANNYADDMVVRTQGSASMLDRAPIQQHIPGRAMTVFQTFVLANWSFLKRNVAGIGNADITYPQAFKRSLTWVGGAALINILFENILQTQSPFPAPITAFTETMAQGKKPGEAAWNAALEMTQMMPIIGSMRFGSSSLGAVADVVGSQVSQKLSGRAGPSKSYMELGGKLAGIPGTQQAAKYLRAVKKGATPLEALFATKQPTKRIPKGVY